jgi:integrase
VPDAVLFTGPKGGPISGGELSSAWRDAVTMVPGAPTGLHIHDLRHAAATMMARMPGVTTKELMARIGRTTSMPTSRRPRLRPKRSAGRPSNHFDRPLKAADASRAAPSSVRGQEAGEKKVALTSTFPVGRRGLEPRTRSLKGSCSTR